MLAELVCVKLSSQGVARIRCSYLDHHHVISAHSEPKGFLGRSLSCCLILQGSGNPGSGISLGAWASPPRTPTPFLSLPPAGSSATAPAHSRWQRDQEERAERKAHRRGRRSLTLSICWLEKEGAAGWDVRGHHSPGTVKVAALPEYLQRSPDFSTTSCHLLGPPVLGMCPQGTWCLFSPSLSWTPLLSLILLHFASISSTFSCISIIITLLPPPS